MQRAGTAAVRLTLWTLVFAALAMALVQPVQAGTEAAPEIQDPAGDQTIADQFPGCSPSSAPVGTCVGNAIDVVTVWIDNETATAFQIHIRTTSNIGGPAVSPGAPAPDIPYGFDNYNAHIIIGADEYAATVSASNGVLLVSNQAANATVVDNQLTIVVLKSAIGNPTAGTQIVGFHVETARNLAPGDPVPANAIASDVAPDTAEEAGVTYTFTGGGSAPADPHDTDGDGMNDSCEQTYFHDLSHNATEDFDHDGLTNGQECALGTDPTKADTDGDGTNDKDDPFPTDPSRGGTSSSSSSTSKSSSSSTSSSASSTSGSRSTTSHSSTSDTRSPSEKLKAEAGYLGMSAGGLIAVLLLCIIALAVRWSL